MITSIIEKFNYQTNAHKKKFFTFLKLKKPNCYSEEKIIPYQIYPKIYKLSRFSGGRGEFLCIFTVAAVSLFYRREHSHARNNL